MFRFFWSPANYITRKTPASRKYFRVFHPSTQTNAKVMQRKPQSRLTSFGGSAVNGVLGAIAGDDLVNAVVSAQWEVDFQDVVAWLHQTEDSLDFLALFFQSWALLHVLDQRILNDLATAVKEVFNLDFEKIDNQTEDSRLFLSKPYHVKEQRILGARDVLQALRDLVVRVAAVLVAHCQWQHLNQFFRGNRCLHNILEVIHFTASFHLNTTRNDKMDFSAQLTEGIDVARDARAQQRMKLSLSDCWE